MYFSLCLIYDLLIELIMIMMWLSRMRISRSYPQIVMLLFYILLLSYKLYNKHVTQKQH